MIYAGFENLFPDSNLWNIMDNYLILVANQAEAQLYQREQKFGELKPLEHYEHEEGRLHEGDLIANDPGMGSPSMGSGMDAKKPANTATETEATRFAGELANALHKTLHNQHDMGLVVIAAPAFLGELRDQVSAEVNDRVMFSIDKNLSPQDKDAIASRIDERLRPDN